MTIGQRIAGKRKELGLSQEALGEKLGVSRQAIYKWEADAALPEIDKLVGLSRTFGVSVGWILGEEETAPEGSGELTEEQLKMVEEIVGRYIGARPEQKPRRKRAWIGWAAVVGGLAAIFALRLAGISHDLAEVRTGYYRLQNSIWEIDDQVGSRISGVAAQVEDILKKQNQLTADYGAELVGADLANDTVTFRIWAVPRTYTEGMEAVFTADYGGGSIAAPGRGEEGRRFAAEVTCPLTDEIRLAAAFATGDKLETQILETFSDLRRDSFANVWVDEMLLWFDEKDGALTDRGSRVTVQIGPSVRFGAWAEGVRCGLFRDRELVCWYDPVGEDGRPLEETAIPPTRDEGVMLFFRRPAGEYPLEPGHSYCEAAVFTDQFGRERVCSSVPLEYSETEGWRPTEQYTAEQDPDGWTY